MDDAQARACQQRDGQLGNHAHVDDGAIAGLQSPLLEYIGKAADQAVQFLVGDHALLAEFAFPDERHLVLARRVQMPVEAIV